MRLLIFSAVVLLIAGCQFGKDQASPVFKEAVDSLYDRQARPFYHGVASGDPLTDRVLIWTRVTPDDSLATIDVRWEVSANDAFEPIFRKGVITTSAERDFTVKVDVDGLDANTYYYY